MGLPFGKGKHINHHQPAYVCTQREELTSLSPIYNMAGGTSHQKEEIKLCYSLNATLDNDSLVIQNFCSVLHGVFVLTLIICLSGHMEKSLLQCCYDMCHVFCHMWQMINLFCQHQAGQYGNIYYVLLHFYAWLQLFLRTLGVSEIRGKLSKVFFMAFNLYLRHFLFFIVAWNV